MIYNFAECFERIQAELKNRFCLYFLAYEKRSGGSLLSFFIIMKSTKNRIKKYFCIEDLILGGRGIVNELEDYSIRSNRAADIAALSTSGFLEEG